MKKELKPVSTALNTINALMVTLDRLGRIVSFNKACEQITGYSFQEIRGRVFWELFLIPEEVEGFQAICEELKAGSSSDYKYESYWVTKDRNRRRITWSNSVIFNDEDAVEYIVGIGIDISAHEPWEKELNQYNKRAQLVSLVTLKIRQSLQLEDILQTTVTQVQHLLQADRVLIYRFWPDGTGSGVTEALIPGCTAILGQTFEAEVFPQKYHQLYASGRIRAIQNVENAEIAHCLVKFLQQFGVKAKLVVPILLKEELWGLLIAHQCSSTRQWSNGEIELLKQLADQLSIAIAQAQYQEHLEELVAQRTAELTNTLERLQQEICDRQLAQELLYRREEEFRALVENSPDLIARFDRQLRHLYVNPSVEKVTGIPKQTFIGKTNQELGMPPQLVAYWHETMLDVFTTGLERIIEFDFPTPTGNKSFQSRIVPELARDGTIESILGVIRDITERKRAEEALRQKAEREQALNRVVRAIRNFLDLETILATAVEEIGKLLPVDRVVIVQYLPDRQLWVNVADYRSSEDLPVALGLEIPDQGNSIAAQLKQSQVVSIDDASVCQDQINRDFAITFPGAWLLVPLHFGSSVWGSLSFVVENRPYPWQEFEVELSLAVAEQLAIAIQQAELLCQSFTATERAQEQATTLAREIADRKRTEETLRSLYKVGTARNKSVDQRLQGLLAMGRRQFGLSMGALGRVENNFYEVVAAQVPPKSSFPIPKGSRWNIEQTYCYNTLAVREPIAFESAGTSQWCNHPAYLISHIEAYIGMPVVVAGNVYGTLSFFSLEVHQNPFTAGDKELLKLMAHWVGAFLERQQTEEELRQSEARFRQLAQRESLLNQLANQIRRSLDLNTILETAVQEIRNLLQIDRCFFLWYRPNTVPAVWEVVQEAKSSSFPSIIGHRVPVSNFGPLTEKVFNKEITRVDSARELTDPIERKFFFSIGYTALLALPIHTTSGEIGVVSCGHSSGSRPWRAQEVELLQAVADQLAIAIDQAQLLEQSRIATQQAQEQATELEQTLRELKETQTQLIQSEKMSSLGQLVAGITHEINNPTNFIYGNTTYVHEYAESLLSLLQLYQECYPQPEPAITALTHDIDLDFIKQDLPKVLSSMRMGTERISQIILSLRNFSRVDQAEMKWVNIHEGLDNTLLILAHRLKTKTLDFPDIQILKDYGNLPKVQCYPGQLNQVFMNILTNAIDAIEDYNKTRSDKEIKSHPGIIWICTQVLANSNQVNILISDNGLGMTPEVQQRIFDPFFTTKPVGQGTGLGMSISYQILVKKHGGQLQCISAPGQGTSFLISLPIQQH